MDINIAEILTDSQKTALGNKVCAKLLDAIDEVDYVTLLTDDFTQLLESEYIVDRINLESVANKLTEKLLIAVKKLK